MQQAVGRIAQHTGSARTPDWSSIGRGRGHRLKSRSVYVSGDVRMIGIGRNLQGLSAIKVLGF